MRPGVAPYRFLDGPSTETPPAGQTREQFAPEFLRLPIETSNLDFSLSGGKLRPAASGSEDGRALRTPKEHDSRDRVDVDSE